MEENIVREGNFCGSSDSREMGGRRGWVDFEVLIAIFEGWKEGGKAVTNGDVAVVVAKLDF